MEKEYKDIIFNYVYDYVELFQNYTNLYIKRILSNITNMEKDILDKFDDIYNIFLNNYKENISDSINIDYINELNKNFTLCLDYSYDLLKENKNIDKINKLIVLINSTYLYCQENNDTYDVPLNEKIEFLKHNYNYCFNKLSKSNDNNEKIILLNCYKNNFFNYSAFYFDSFNETYKKELDEKIELILVIIKNNSIDDNFINNLSNNNNANDNEIIILLNCYKNNFYDYSAFYFDNFSETYKNKLDEKFELIIEIIKNNFIDDNFIIKFLEEQNYELQPYKNVS
jgi:hypothetical protein